MDGIIEDFGVPYVIGQVLGVAVAIMGFFIYFVKQRKNILMAKLSCDALSAIQSALIGAFTGACVNVIAIFRELVFYSRDLKKWANSILWLFAFIALMLISPIVSWHGAVSLLPAAGSTLACIGFYLKNPMKMRIVSLFALSFWMAYTVCTFNIGGMLQNSISIFAAVAGIIRDIVIKKKENQYHR